jgi:hypothetical protein
MIVVSRYNENVEWTKQFPNVLIYNKGEPLESGYNELFLENVGREGHTYYKYICDNYENLPKYTVFLQGNPFDHSPNIITNIHKYMNNPDIDFEFLSERIYPCNLSGCRYDVNLVLTDVYEKVFGIKKTEMPFVFGQGAQFIVSKERILKRPKEFYANIVELLGYTNCPLEGFVIERIHCLIFSDSN